MPQVMIGLSTKDYKTLSQAWRTAKRELNPMTRRRMGLRGRSSLLRELILFGFEKAAAEPASFLNSVRDSRDPLFGRGRTARNLGEEKRESQLAAWEAFFPADTGKRARARKPSA